jgi:hypothetical protein
VVVLGSQNCNYTKNVDSLIGVECKGDGDGKIVVSASGGMGNFTYALDNPNDFVSSGSFANLEAGTYRVFFNDGNCITDTSLTVEAQDSISKPSVLRDGDTLRGPQAPSYQWYRDGSAIQGATSREYVVTQDGDYFLEVISSSGNCNAFSDTTEVIINSIADRQGSDAWLSIRPNPSAGAFTISAEGLTAHQPVRLRMMDVNGRVLRRQIFEPAGTQLSQTLQRKDLPAGIYLLELQQGNRSSTRKLMLR